MRASTIARSVPFSEAPEIVGRPSLTLRAMSISPNPVDTFRPRIPAMRAEALVGKRDMSE